MKTRTLTISLLFFSCILKGQNSFHKTYGGFGQDHASCVRQTTDGGYIISGESPFIVNESGAYIVKTNQNGDTLWTQLLDNCRGSSIRQTTDGGYIIGGSTPDTWGTGNSDIVLIKTDGGGNLMWNKQFPRYSADYATSVLQTNDGGYIVAGYFIESSGAIHICLIKTNANGNILWSKFGTGLRLII
jgi:hypothetical protein